MPYKINTYTIAQWVRKHLHLIWDMIELVNAHLFALRYRHVLQLLPNEIETEDPNIRIKSLQKKDIPLLADMLTHQSDKSLYFFHPHAFDEKSLLQLFRNPSMIQYAAWHDNTIVGYCFLRCFFTGKGFRGYLTDERHTRRGIGRNLGICLNRVADTLQIPTYKSINNDNIASLRLAEATCRIDVLEINNNEQLIRCYTI